MNDLPRTADTHTENDLKQIKLEISVFANDPFTQSATKEEIQGAVSPFTCGQKIMTSVVELMPHLVSEGVLGSSYFGNKRSEVRMWVWA